jgi:hypothetical protein
MYRRRRRQRNLTPFLYRMQGWLNEGGEGAPNHVRFRVAMHPAWCMVEGMTENWQSAFQMNLFCI